MRSIIEASREESFEVDAENVVGPRVFVIAQTLEPHEGAPVDLDPPLARGRALAGDGDPRGRQKAES